MLYTRQQWRSQAFQHQVSQLNSHNTFRKNEAIAIVEYRTIYQNEQVLIFERCHNDEHFWIAINFSSDAIAPELPELNGEVALSTHLDRIQAISSTVELRADEGVLIKQLPILS